MEPKSHPDWALVERLGGPSKVAEMLEYPRAGGAQRVQNWKLRGIPASVKVARPDLFLPGVVAAANDPSSDSAPSSAATPPGHHDTGERRRITDRVAAGN